MVVIFVGNFFKFRDIQQRREIVEVEHGVVFAVVAKERDILAEVHILQMIGNETAVTTLYPLAEFL